MLPFVCSTHIPPSYASRSTSSRRHLRIFYGTFTQGRSRRDCPRPSGGALAKVVRRHESDDRRSVLKLARTAFSKVRARTSAFFYDFHTSRSVEVGCIRISPPECEWRAFQARVVRGATGSEGTLAPGVNGRARQTRGQSKFVISVRSPTRNYARGASGGRAPPLKDAPRKVARDLRARLRTNGEAKIRIAGKRTQRPTRIGFL